MSLLDFCFAGALGVGALGLKFILNVNKLDKNASNEMNTLLFAGIPVVLYALLRLGTGLSFAVSDKYLKGASSTVFKYLSAAGCFAAVMWVPYVGSSFVQTYQNFVGDIPDLLYKTYEKEIKKNKEFAMRVFHVCIAVVLLISVLELLFRLLCAVVRAVLKGFTGRRRKKAAPREK